MSTKISSYGIAIGYIAALLVQTIGILVVIAFQSSNLGLRLVLFIIGVWWFIFTIPTAKWLRSRPGPPLHIGAQTSNFRTALAYFTYSWKSLGRTVAHARHLKDVLLFLAAWFLLSDSIATVSGTAVLFAKTTLGMSYAMLALINVIATISGVLGAFLWSRLASLFRLSPTQTILMCIALFEFIPIYGLLGYIPAVQRLGYLGLQQQWEMYLLGAVYGFVLGGLSSYCRALFGELIPPGYEAAFYALYAITDKGSSIFGPAIVGAITDAYGEIRPVSPLQPFTTFLSPHFFFKTFATPFFKYLLTFPSLGILVPSPPSRPPIPHHDARRPRSRTHRCPSPRSETRRPLQRTRYTSFFFFVPATWVLILPLLLPLELIMVSLYQKMLEGILMLRFRIRVLEYIN